MLVLRLKPHSRLPAAMAAFMAVFAGPASAAPASITPIDFTLPDDGYQYGDPYFMASDGSALVFYEENNTGNRYSYWSSSGGSVTFGTLGGSSSEVLRISANGSAAIGYSYTPGDAAQHAFRWTQGGGMQDLGTLGGNSSRAVFISSDGNIVVGFANNGVDNEAFRWTQGGGMAGLGTLGGSYSYANAMTADANAIVGYSLNGSGFDEAFRWTQGGGMVGLGFIGGNYSEARFISADGNTVAGSATDASSHNHAFYWTQGTGMVDPGTLGGNSTYLEALSANGTVLVGSSNLVGGQEHAFRWTQSGGMQDLGVIRTGGGFSSARFVSTDGSVIAGRSDNNLAGSSAFRWTQGTGMVDLGTLGGTNSIPRAMTADGGTIIGSSTNAGAQNLAFRWTAANGMESLQSILSNGGVDLTGWVLSNASQLSADGTIVAGQGDMGGYTRAFIANLGSTPGVTTPEGLATSLNESIVPAQQSQAIASSGVGQSLLAARQALSSFGSIRAPKHIAAATPTAMNDLEPAAGAMGISAPRLYSAYMVGTLAGGQNNDFNNYGLNGTAGMLVRVGDDIAVGGGILAGNSTTRLDYSGNSDVTATGASLLGAYEPKNGIRLYATAMLAYLHAQTDRNYLNGSGIDGSRGETQGYGYGLATRGGYAFDISKTTSIMPYGELQWSRTSLDGYGEKGGAFPAAYSDQKNYLLTSRLGAEVSHNVSKDLELRTRAAWGHRVSGRGSSLTATTIGLTQPLTAQQGDPDWLEGAITTTWRVSDTSHFTAEIGGRLGNTEEPAVTATFGWSYSF